MGLIHTQIGSSIAVAAQWLREGQLVAIPTETVYGLAGNALHEKAVLAIFRAKSRPQFNPLIIHVANWKQVENYCQNIPDLAHQLAAQFSPGPITFLLPKKEIIPDLITAGSPKVAVRIPAHPVIQELLESVDFPLAAPSANLFGYVSPVTAQHVWDGLAGKIPYILDGGPCAVGLESTIVDFENEQIIIRRNGGISVAQIGNAAGVTPILQTSANEHPVAPGMLASHYATKTPLFYDQANSLPVGLNKKRLAIIGWGTQEEIKAQANELGVQAEIILSLSDSKQLDEAARNLFSLLRQADQSGVEHIVVLPVSNTDIGLAIHDRLLRAAHG